MSTKDAPRFKAGDTVKFWQPGTPYGADECYHGFNKSIGTVVGFGTRNPWPKGHPKYCSRDDYSVCKVLVLKLGMPLEHLILDAYTETWKAGQVVERHERWLDPYHLPS